MSIVNDFKVKMVEHGICELNVLKKGDVTTANKMLTERMENMNRLWALQCLIDQNDSDNDEIISYLYEQIKELTSKIIL